MACCIFTAYVMNRIIRACDILHIDIIKIQYNDFDDGPERGQETAAVLSRIAVDGMTCAACISTIYSALRPLPGVGAVTVSLPLARVSIVHNSDATTVSKLIATIEDCGYTASHGERDAQRRFDLIRKTEDLESLRKTFSNTGSLAAIAISIQYVGALLPPVLHVSAVCTLAVCMLGLYVQLVEALWLHKNAWRKGSVLHPNMDTLISLSLLFGLLLSALNLCNGDTAATETYMVSGSFLVVVVTGGRYLETIFRRETNSSLAQLYSMQAESALAQFNKVSRQRNDISQLTTLESVPALALQPDDEFILPAGATVPCDCYVIDGNSVIDQASMTGEHLPVSKKTGDFLMSGTRNIARDLHAIVSKPQEESALEGLVNSISAATDDDTSHDFVATLSTSFVRIILLTATFAAFASFYRSGPSLPTLVRLTRAGERLMAILASACPCALGLATPSAVMSSLSVAWSRGIILCGGSKTIQDIAELTHLVMDKTGTLTTGQIAVSDVTGAMDATLLTFVCAAEREEAQVHPVGNAVFKWALQQLSETDRLSQSRLTTFDISNTLGQGVSCKVQSTTTPTTHTLHIGSAAFLHDHAIPLSTAFSTAQPIQGGVIVHIALDSTHVTTLTLQDTVRPEASKVITNLQTQHDLSISMLTGDTETEAQRVSTHLNGIPVLSAQLPLQKQAYINDLRQYSPTPGRSTSGGGATAEVAMLGDGLNDSAALAAADVGILLCPRGFPGRAARSSQHTSVEGTQQQAPTQLADVIITSPDLGRVQDLMVISKRTVRQIRWNVCWAVGYNVIAVCIAAGALELWGVAIDAARAGTVMALSSVSVLGWSLWFRKSLERAVCR